MTCEINCKIVYLCLSFHVIKSPFLTIWVANELSSHFRICPISLPVLVIDHLVLSLLIVSFLQKSTNLTCKWCVQQLLYASTMSSYAQGRCCCSACDLENFCKISFFIKYFVKLSEVRFFWHLMHRYLLFIYTLLFKSIVWQWQKYFNIIFRVDTDNCWEKQEVF